MTITKKVLQTRMLADISEDYDKSEGSFFFDAIAPVAIELEKAYTMQDSILNNVFVDTATGEYLERKCAELGINRKTATKAMGKVQITGAAGATIAKGIYVATEIVTFITTESITIGETGIALVSVECAENGIVGNVAANTIKYFPITLEGLTGVTNLEAFTSGYDEETDRSIRERFYDKINTPATSGNASHYGQWAKEVVGVGDAKILPIWNGAGTVKVVICDRNKRAADAELINATKAYIDKNRPIGATVTVESATEKAIDVTATIQLGNGRTLIQVKADFETALIQYFRNIAFVDNYISYAKIGSILYDVYGVADYSLLTVNTGNTNIALTATEIPVLGTVVLS